MREDCDYCTQTVSEAADEEERARTIKSSSGSNEPSLRFRSHSSSSSSTVPLFA